MEYLMIGQLLKPQGLDGELKVKPLTSDSHRFKNIEFVYIKENTNYRKLKITNVRISRDTVYLKIDGVTSRDEAESFRSQYLWIDRSHAVSLPDNTYFVYEIIGCTVYNLQGNDLGQVIDVIETGSNDVYIVRKDNLKENELLIPALKTVVQHISIAHKKIIIDASQLEEVVVLED